MRLILLFLKKIKKKDLNIQILIKTKFWSVFAWIGKSKSIYRLEKKLEKYIREKIRKIH